VITAPPAPALELEDDGDLRVGRPVRGTIVVTAVDPLGAGRLIVHARLREAHVDLVDEPRVELGPFEWSAGETRVAFELPLLRGPASYAGRVINLSWTIVAEVRSDAKAVLASRSFPIDVRRRSERDESGEVVGGYRDVPRHVELPFEPRLGSEHVEGARAPKLTLSERLGKALSASPALDALLETAPLRLEPGATFVVTLFLYAREATTLESARVALLHHEGSSTFGSASEIATAAEAPLAERVELAPGHHRFKAELALPPDAAASYAEAGVVLEWVARAVVRAERTAPIVRELVLTVA